MTETSVAPWEAVRVFEGRWTIRGMEDRFNEVGEIFPGGRHIVCYATSQKGEDVSRHMSIITWSEEEGCYLYFGIGSAGSVRTLRAQVADGVWTFHGTSKAGGVSKAVRVTIRPLNEGFQFLEELSEDGLAWTVDADFEYIRVPNEA
jgi:hypothetical protein